jgi:hypothetical protein
MSSIVVPVIRSRIEYSPVSDVMTEFCFFWTLFNWCLKNTCETIDALGTFEEVSMTEAYLVMFDEFIKSLEFDPELINGKGFDGDLPEHKSILNKFFKLNPNVRAIVVRYGESIEENTASLINDYYNIMGVNMYNEDAVHIIQIFSRRGHFELLQGAPQDDIVDVVGMEHMQQTKIVKEEQEEKDFLLAVQLSKQFSEIDRMLEEQHARDKKLRDAMLEKDLEEARVMKEQVDGDFLLAVRLSTQSDQQSNQYPQPDPAFAIYRHI